MRMRSAPRLGLGPTELPAALMAVARWPESWTLMDRAVYQAIGSVSAPRLDKAMVRVSNAANYSRLWLAPPPSWPPSVAGRAAGRHCSAWSASGSPRR